jgi:tRNA (guanine-N7-)-methyltransferase
MGKQKLYRYATVGTFSNVVELNPKFKGVWAKEFFGNTFPITLELACGKGHYVLALAEKHPNQNFLGVDIKGERLFVGARIGLAQGLSNAGFLRTQIEDLTQYFEAGEVHEIWITFPDPYLRKPEKRLTSARFLSIYRQILAPGGIIHLKTDSPELEESTLSVLQKHQITPLAYLPDIYAALPQAPERPEAIADQVPLYIQTHYERLHLKEGRTIRYIAFQLDQS